MERCAQTRGQHGWKAYDLTERQSRDERGVKARQCGDMQSLIVWRDREDAEKGWIVGKAVVNSDGNVLELDMGSGARRDRDRDRDRESSLFAEAHWKGYPFLISNMEGTTPREHVPLGENLNIFNQLGQGIRLATTLARLDLRDSGIGSQEMKEMGLGLKSHPSLKVLILSGNALRDEGIFWLKEAIVTMPGLRILDIADNGVRLKGAISMGEALKAGIPLEELDIGANQLKGNGLREMFPKGAESCRLKKIWLHANLIGNNRIEWFCKWLVRNNTITHIDLGFNNLDKDSVSFVKRLVTDREIITNVNLWGNPGVMASVGEKGSIRRSKKTKNRRVSNGG